MKDRSGNFFAMRASKPDMHHREARTGWITGALLATGLALSSTAHAQTMEPWMRNLVQVPRLPDSDPAMFTRTTPATPAAARVMETVGQIALTMVSTKYVHSTRVNAARGQYDFDCSGMVAWILARSAPRAWASMHSNRPLAADFAETFRVGRARGWQRVHKLEDARAGDVLAWKRPSWFPSPNTGHVVVLLAAPERVVGLPNLMLVRVADSTRGVHEDDSRNGRYTGFGVGTLLIPVDPITGEGTGYGWFGSQSGWVVPTAIVVGRPTG